MDEIQQAREYGDAQRAEGHEAGLAEGKMAGEAKGKASAVLAILAARGINVSAAIRTHVATCRDMATLDRWITKAVSVASAEELVSSKSSG